MSDTLPHLVLISGPSGAGRSTALNTLEDLGFETIDNLPISMVARLLAQPVDHPLALGIDVRNRDFSPNALSDMLDALSNRTDLKTQLVFLDARINVLERRYSETRRRHPLSQGDSPKDGLIREFDLVGPARDRADLVIDTSDLTPHDLRRELTTWVADPRAARMALSMLSFSYKTGVPSGADLVFDCRFLRNPYWEAGLRALNGQDAEVSAYVQQDDAFQPFFERLQDLLDHLLPAYRREGKAHLTVALGCTGGQHRSVAVAEMLGSALANKGWHVSIEHRELGRRH